MAQINGTSFNIGTDLSVVVVDNNSGTPVNLGGRVIDYKATSKVTQITSSPIDNKGYDNYRLDYHGWTGTITVDRSGAQGDNLMAQGESDYHNGKPQRFYTITETIIDANTQAINVFQHTGCVVWQQDTGNFKKDQAVQQMYEFHSQERVQIA